jgi:uncharacterized protein
MLPTSSAFADAPAGGSPARRLLLLIGFLLLGMSLGAVAGGLIQAGFMHLPPGTDLITAPPDPRNWYPLMVMQGLSHLASFLLPTLLFVQFIERRRWASLSTISPGRVAALGLVPLIVIVFMPFDALIIEWNQALHLPPPLADTEQWMREQEDRLADLTRFLTTFRSPGQLAMALLVIGLIPAVGEEVLFRGVLQPLLTGWARNPHAGIWLSAVLFSAIHVQFLGFFPRLLLGALFGYLYHWSGNMWVPILAHFTNNGFTVLMIWLHTRGLVGVDIENTTAVSPAVALPAGLLTAALLWYFWQRNRSEKQTDAAKSIFPNDSLR